MSSDDEHFPWHYTEFGVACVCGASMNADEQCPDAPPPADPVRVDYCTCAGPCPGYPQHEEHCGWIAAEEAGTA